jgi:hypothetical protein
MKKLRSPIAHQVTSQCGNGLDDRVGIDRQRRGRRQGNKKEGRRRYPRRHKCWQRIEKGESAIKLPMMRMTLLVTYGDMDTSSLFDVVLVFSI